MNLASLTLGLRWGRLRKHLNLTYPLSLDGFDQFVAATGWHQSSRETLLKEISLKEISSKEIPSKESFGCKQQGSLDWIEGHCDEVSAACSWTFFF